MPAGNITIALSNVTTGQYIQVEITQDGGGSRTAVSYTHLDVYKRQLENRPLMVPFVSTLKACSEPAA